MYPFIELFSRLVRVDSGLRWKLAVIRAQLLACSAFSSSAQFARESAMLKLPEERRRWGESKGAGRGRPGGEREENFLPSPFPLSFFRPRTYRKGYYFYSPQSSTVIKSKTATTKISRTRTRFRPPKIRLPCRLLTNRIISSIINTQYYV